MTGECPVCGGLLDKARYTRVEYLPGAPNLNHEKPWETVTVCGRCFAAYPYVAPVREKRKYVRHKPYVPRQKGGA